MDHINRFSSFPTSPSMSAFSVSGKEKHVFLFRTPTRSPIYKLTRFLNVNVYKVVWQANSLSHSSATPPRGQLPHLIFSRELYRLMPCIPSETFLPPIAAGKRPEDPEGMADWRRENSSRPLVLGMPLSARRLGRDAPRESSVWQ